MGENIILKKKALIASVLLIFIFMIGAVSAGENNTNEIYSNDITDNNEVISKDIDSEETLADIETKITSDDSTVINGNDFTVRLSSKDGLALSNQTVNFNFNGTDSSSKTDNNGLAKLKINAQSGIYTIKFSFSKSGYTNASGEKSVLVVKNTTSKITISDYDNYITKVNNYTAVLTVDGVRVPSKTIRFVINGTVYTAQTNSKGKAGIILDPVFGIYSVTAYFDGDSIISPSSANATITLRKMITSISRANNIKYVSKVKKPFKVQLTDIKGKPVVNQTVVFKINGKKYKRVTDEEGMASINIKLKKGTYKIKYKFYKTDLYKKSSGSSKIKVKSSGAVNNGFWVFGADMKKINLATVAKHGVNNILLNFKAFDLHGKSAVVSFIKKAKSYGIKVHIWMQAFYYNGKWHSPVYSDGSFKYSYFKTKINEAKKYAKVSGVAGVHMDYLRFPGTAYKHTNGVKAINYFTKEVSKAVHKINSKLIVSAAIMPEPSSNKYYYGQDIPTISKYLDVLVPMIYKGNYGTGRNWIKSTTSTFISQSKSAEVWSGLQSYHSDSDVSKLSASELKGDSKYAQSGGATGVILFRYGLINFFNFNSL